MSTTGVAHRMMRFIADVPDLEDSHACIRRPDNFDLDIIGKDAAAVREAVWTCTHACPVVESCHRWTMSLANNPATRPHGVIQAGLVWGGPGRSGKHRPRAAAA